MRAETSRAATRPAATPWLVAATLALLLLSATMAGGLPSNSPFEGLQVHGHWTIQVTNPDGSPGGMFEFDNDLTTGGQVLAPLLLAGDSRLLPDDFVGTWLLYVGDRDFLDLSGGFVQGTSPCPAAGFPFADGEHSFSMPFIGSVTLLVETTPDVTFMSSGCLLGGEGYTEGFGLLPTVAPLEATMPDVGVARLSGTFDAFQDGTIDRVSSWFVHEESNTDTVYVTQVTSADVTPVEVVAGQQVTVTVDFTFS